MNRIYQGKVSRVDILRGKDNWEELREWQSFLWYHHELFQDAVNYYTLALAALGIGLPDEHSMSQLRRQMEVTAWKEFPKRHFVKRNHCGNPLRLGLALARMRLLRKHVL